MINNIFQTLVSLSISGSIIALVLFALKPLIHNRFGKTWQFYIWLVVVARLLIPYVPPLNVVEEVSKFAKQYEVATEIPTDIEHGSQLQKDTTESGGLRNDTLNILNNEVVNQQINTEPNANVSESPALTVGQELSFFLQQSLPYRGLIWLVICIVLLVRKITSYYGFIRFVKKGSKVITDDSILEQYHDTCELLGIKKLIPLYASSIVVSPMCIGFFKHSIVLPDKQLVNLTHLQYIFRHELMHYKRLDIYYKWLVQIVLCIHWFNPIAYFVGKEVNQYCELSCDEIVIKRLNTAEQKAYGDTLLHSLELGGHYSHAVVSLTLTENTKLMKERLSAIMKFRNKSRMVICLSSLLTVILCTGAMFTGVYAKTGPMVSEKQYTLDENTLESIVTDEIITKTKTIKSAVNSTVTMDEILNGIEPIPNHSFYAVGYSSNWAAATSIEGDTYKEQLDEKIKWIENIYNDKKEKFAIIETVPSENELTNLSGAQYMFENSSIYKNIISNYDSFLLTPYSGNWFSKTSKNKTEYDRSIFYIDESATLALKAKYELSQGKMAIMIVSPDFKTVYRSEQSKQFDDTITIPVSKGLWSIVTVTEYENGSIIGSKNMQGNITHISDSKELAGRSDSLTQNFEKYKPFGITYNVAQDAVYYNGERVKLFVDFKSYKEESMTYAFELCYQDGNTNSVLYLEAVKDDNSNVIAIRPLKNEIAKDLLSHKIVSAYNSDTEKDKDNDNIPFVAMDATHVIEGANIVAKDLTKDKVTQNIKDWIERCDKKQGTYMLKIKTESGYDTYVYYNGGGRYPWNMSEAESNLTINLYSTSLATNEGYYLVHFTAPKDYKNIKLYLNNKELANIESS